MSGKEEEKSFSFGKMSCGTTVEEARRLIVPVAEDFLNEINSHPEIADELVQFPFTWDNIQIGIIFKTPDYQRIFEPYVWSTSIHYGIMHYYILVDGPPIPNQKRYQDADKEETYAEAKRILAAEALKMTPQYLPQNMHGDISKNKQRDSR